MNNSLPGFEQLDDDTLMGYLQHFLEIAQFKKIENGKGLLAAIRENPEHPKTKSIIRKVLALFLTDAPGAKVCSLQFLKEAMETNSWSAVELVQKTLLPQVVQVVEYRPHIRSIQRGSSYFIAEIDKDLPDDNLSNLIKLSSTFFRMIHECVYVWGAHYFPGSSFDRMRIKLMKRFDFPKYPQEFKFFTDKKIEAFSLNCQDTMKKMKQHNEEEISRSSLEKKREASVRPGKVSSNVVSGHSRSQSTQQLSQINPKTSAKQRQKLNEEKRLSSAKNVEKQQNKKQKQQQRSQTPQEKEKERSLTNSSLLRKKNSFTEVSLETSKEQESGKNLSSKANQLKSKDQTNQQQRFRTISQQSDSQGGRYSLKESKQQTSQQFSEIDYAYDDRENQSPRSMLSLKKQREIKKMPLKKFISQQITNQIAGKQALSLNQARGNQKKKQSQKKEKEVQQNGGGMNAAQKQRNTGKEVAQKQKRNQYLNSPSRNTQPIQDKLTNKKQGKTTIKNIPKLPLPVQRPAQQRRKRKDESARKKFVTSQEQNSQKQPQKQPENNLLQQQLSSKQRPEAPPTNNESKTPKVEKISASNNKIKLIQEENTMKNQTKKNEQAPIPKPIKMAKPQKIKGSGSAKTAFQATEYSIVQIINEPKPIKKAATQNRLPVSNRANSPKKQDSHSLDFYKMVQQIQDQDLVTIQLKKVTQKQLQQSQLNQSLQLKHKQRYQQAQKLNEYQQLQPIRERKNQKSKTGLKVQSQLQKQSISLKQELKIQRIHQIEQYRDQHIPKRMVQINSKEYPNLTVSKPESTRSYSPIKLESSQANAKPFQTPVYSHRQMLGQTPQDSFKLNKQQRQKSYSKGRLKKQQQVCMVIHPHDESASEIQLKSRANSMNQFKEILKSQISEEFLQLKNTFFCQQQESLQQTIELYASKLKSQVKQTQTAVDCGIQARIRQKQKARVASKRRFRILDQDSQNAQNGKQANAENGKQANAANEKLANAANEKQANAANEKLANAANEKQANAQSTILNTSPNILKPVEPIKQHKIADQPISLKNRGNSKNKNKTKQSVDQYQPNTLLYALFRKRTMVQ